MEYALEEMANGALAGIAWMTMPNSYIKQDVGRRIAIRRAGLNLTQAQLAASIGVGQPHLSNLERGRRSLHLDKLQGLARALRCTMADLLPDPERSPD